VVHKHKTSFKNPPLNTIGARASAQGGNKNNIQDSLWLYGKHSALAAISKNRRKIFSILATKNTIDYLNKFLREKNLQNFEKKIKIVDNNYIESKVGRDQVHQGLAVNCSFLETKTFDDINFDEEKIILILDQLSDPQNVGAIARSALAFGVKTIIILSKNSPKETSAVHKASSGMLESIDLIEVVNISECLKKLKKNKFWCIGLDGSAKNLISSIKQYDKIALVVGNEGFGIRELVKKNCDLLAKIPISDEVESLNGSVATSIALYSIKLENTKLL
jgi:23S rRNA (guanosine2251-2'-O)-methyltransferase